MEKKLEKAIDNGLENVSSQLYIFSIVAGIVLIVLGIILILRKHSHTKKSKESIGLTCIVIGIVVIFSGITQLYL